MNETQKIVFHIYDQKENSKNWAEGVEVCYILRGKGLLIVNHEGRWEIRENDIFVLNPYDRCQMVLEPEGKVLSLQIPELFMLSLYPEMESMRIECFSFLFGKEKQKFYDEVRNKIADIFSLYNKNDPKSQICMRGLAACLLSKLILFFGKPKGNVQGKEAHEQLHQLMEYVRLHYQEEISLKQFAEQSYFSVSHLTHLLRKEMGCSFTEYLTSVRLAHAMHLLKQGKSVTEVSGRTGFVNSNAFIKAFRDSYGTTPGKYKKEYMEIPAEVMETVGSKPEQADGQSHLFDRLLSYVSKDSWMNLDMEIFQPELCRLSVNLQKHGKEMPLNWKFSINGGYAKGLLVENVREVIRKVQEEIGFQYIRCKGIFDDELQICSRNAEGNLVFNYVFLDQVLDFICSCHARPWLELSYMPSALCREKRKADGDIWFIAMPDQQEEWLTMVRCLIVHMQERYGIKEMSRWILTPFADVFLVNMHMKEKNGYYELYEKTYRLLKSLLPQTRIAARGDFKEDGSGLGDYMVRKKILPDIWTLINFNSVSPSEEESDLNLVETMEAYSMVISSDTQHLEHQIDLWKRKLEDYGAKNIPLILAEWNSTIWQRDLCNDIAYKSCYMVKNILENCESILGFTYWHVSDWNYEYLPSPHCFHGGFGLFTMDNIPKAAYGALQLLNLAEGEILKREEGCFILKAEGKIIVYLYHFCPYDMLYRYRHIRDISLQNRYVVFETKNDICYQIHLKHMNEGRYQKKVYRISPEEGSACDFWMRIGAPENMSPLVQKSVFEASVPGFESSYEEIGTEYMLQSTLEPHEVQLIILEQSE